MHENACLVPASMLRITWLPTQDGIGFGYEFLGSAGRVAEADRGGTANADEADARIGCTGSFDRRPILGGKPFGWPPPESEVGRASRINEGKSALTAVTMKWRVEFRPEVELDMAEAAEWYESRQPGLGVEFIEEVVRVWDSLSENPLLNSRRLPNRNIRWRYPDHFP